MKNPNANITTRFATVAKITNHNINFFPAFFVKKVRANKITLGTRAYKKVIEKPVTIHQYNQVTTTTPAPITLPNQPCPLFGSVQTFEGNFVQIKYKIPGTNAKINNTMKRGTLSFFYFVT